jgi:ankyrin repeat protein
MILDNANDPSLFFNSAEQRESHEVEIPIKAAGSLSDFLPKSQNGLILITSRDRDVAFRLTGSYRDIIRVEPMDKALALALLQKKLGGCAEDDDAIKLIHRLNYMPLAIIQAAAYIKQMAPRTTISTYLNVLSRRDGDKISLLKKDVDIRNSVISTWQISFERIRKVKASAARLLSLMSFFDPQGIPEILLLGYYENGGDRVDFKDDLNTLISYSLLAKNVDGNEFEMHGLVQFSTKIWLALHDELEQWKEKCITIMVKAFPTRDFENRELCHWLFPHAEVALACQPKNDNYIEPWTTALVNAAWYARVKASYKVAEKMDRDARYARVIALHSVAGNGNETVTRLLLENGYDISAKDKDGKTALHCAASNGHDALVRLLLEKGAEVASKDNIRCAALHYAARNGHLAVVQLLVENGANVNERERLGDAALHWAAGGGHEAIVRHLLEKGAPVSGKGHSSKSTPLHWAAYNGREAVVKLLLEEGAFVAAKNRTGETALHVAAGETPENVVQLLLENGADVDEKDNYGRTAMYEAALRGHEMVVRLLLENGADVAAKDKEGKTAPQVAREGRHQAVVRLLQQDTGGQ